MGITYVIEASGIFTNLHKASVSYRNDGSSCLLTDSVTEPMLGKPADSPPKSPEMKERHFIQSQVRFGLVTSRQSIKVKSE
jgi:hypothetical protein